MNVSVYLIPVAIITLFIYAAIKKIPVYDVFVSGSKKAIPLIIDLLPYIAGMMILSEVFTVSGLNTLLQKTISPAFRLLGIPEEICPLVVVKPFSGSGSLGILENILKNYGADSYVGKVASVAYGSSETIFYVSAVYYSAAKKKIPFAPIVISLVSSFLSIALASLLCRIM